MDPHLATPSGKPRARSLGIPFDGMPGAWNAITDVPGLEVGTCTLVEGTDVRTGVTAIHPRGRANPGDPCAAGTYSLNGNGEMTGVTWIEESGTCGLPIAIASIAILAFFLVLARRPALPPEGIGPAVGFGAGTGLIGGFAGIPGPTAVYYFVRDGVPANASRASLLVVFFWVNGNVTAKTAQFRRCERV